MIAVAVVFPPQTVPERTGVPMTAVQQIAAIESRIAAPARASLHVPPLPGRRLEKRSLASVPAAGVLMDMGDVLYDATVWRRWLLMLLSRMGVHTHYRAFYYLWDHEYLREVQCGRREFWQALRELLLNIGLTNAHIDEVIAAAQARYRDLEEGVRPMPGAHRAIARLAEMKVPLGVVSNAHYSSERLSMRLEQLGLRKYFDSIVSSYDVGAALPDHRCYGFALQQLSTGAERTVFLGHDAEELAGARSLGMKTIAFNYDPHAIADVYLEQFEQLPLKISTH